MSGPECAHGEPAAMCLHCAYLRGVHERIVAMFLDAGVVEMRFPGAMSQTDLDALKMWTSMVLDSITVSSEPAAK